ncbi:hypothetical protein D3C81_2204710 [compost metagenome]
MLNSMPENAMGKGGGQFGQQLVGADYELFYNRHRCLPALRKRAHRYQHSGFSDLSFAWNHPGVSVRGT